MSVNCTDGATKGTTMKNGQIKIEKGIPLPDKRQGSQNPLIEQMKKMKNGDSFLYPILKRTTLSFCARKAQIVISTRTVDEQTVRCWRIKERFPTR